MTICMVRHGQSIWQVLPSDDLDSPLTPMGHRQSRLIGRWFSNRDSFHTDLRKRVRTIRVSPLKRALQTAAYVCEGLSLQAVTQANLLEADFHVADHLPTRSMPLADPGTLASEAYQRFKAQVKEAMSELMDAATEQEGELLAVTHGAFIETALRLVVGNDTVRFPVSNTSLTVLRWEGGHWHLPLLNFTGHLPYGLRTS